MMRSQPSLHLFYEVQLIILFATLQGHPLDVMTDYKTPKKTMITCSISLFGTSVINELVFLEKKTNYQDIN